ncbi:MAG: ABC transporter permease subunit [Thermoplasmata archaeon]
MTEQATDPPIGALGAAPGATTPGASTHRPRSGPEPNPFRGSAYRSAAIYVGLPLAVVLTATISPGLSLGQVASYLPTASVDVTYSFFRMVAAYTLSLGFALGYGYYAATRRSSERVMIPVLDILQSVPILGFFPVVIVLFVSITGPGTFLGPNLASVFLIFTSMSWNMVFGVYESLKTLPTELREASDTFGLRGFLKFRRVLFPATVNRLVYNSVLSWTGGWFFLVEAEIFTTNGPGLPGIGSFLSYAAADGNGAKFLAGLLMLVLVIVILDFAVWRPLGRRAQRYRYDQSPSGEGDLVGTSDARGRFRRAASYVTRGVRSGVTRISTPLVQLAAIRIWPSHKPSPLRRSAVSYLAIGSILIVVWLMLIAIVVAVFHVYSGPIPSSVQHQILELPAATGASTLRLVSAYAICLLIALPLAILIARSRRAARYGLPAVEVIASFPATALFPAIIFVLVPYLRPDGVAVLMLMTGMIWYLFFNLLSGVRSIPPDLEEAARAFGVKGRRFFQRVLFPGIFGALVTGSITAFGGGWNTLIVAEYLNVNSTHSLSVLGLGQMIDVGYTEPNGLPLMVTALLTLVATVIAINELLWKPLYHRAVERFRFD